MVSPHSFLSNLLKDPLLNSFPLYSMYSASTPDPFSNTSLLANFTANNLKSYTIYSFRVIPLYSSDKGRGKPSEAVSARTLAPAIVYWEFISSRRISLTGYGQGFSNPVLGRPHLSTGVQIHKEGISNNPLRYSDPPIDTQSVLPSGRRGHTLSTLQDKVLMFGGRTNGNMNMIA
jgi:hypothetical protein